MDDEMVDLPLREFRHASLGLAGNGIQQQS
jgi:hypothetical protein